MRSALRRIGGSAGAEMLHSRLSVKYARLIHILTVSASFIGLPNVIGTCSYYVFWMAEKMETLSSPETIKFVASKLGVTE